MSTITFDEALHPRANDGTFAEKPQSAPEVSLHPDSLAARATRRKERHDQLLAEGALASAYDNVHIMDFEDEHGEDADPAGMFDAIATIGAGWDSEEDYYNEDIADERRMAVGELSRRIARGQEGELRELGRLRPGDRIDLSRLSEDAYEDDAAFPPAPDYSIVTSSDVAAGEAFVRLEDGLVVLPDGVLVPVIPKEEA